MTTILEELVQSWRALRRAGWFTTASIATLGLGTAATVAVFTVLNALYLRPLPWHEGDRLVRLHEAEPGGDSEWTVAPVSLAAWREAEVFDDIVYFNVAFPILSSDAGSDQIQGAVVSRNFFDVLGTPAALGRTPDATAEDEVVVSDEFWRTRLGRRGDVIGTTLRLNGREHTIVGVMPNGFRHPSAQFRLTPLLWTPFRVDDTQSGRFLHVVARLAPGRTVQDADSELRAIARAIAETYPRSHAGWSSTVRPLRESLYDSARTGTFLLFAAAALVLGVACLNVANLTLTRNASRFREFTVRAALGAGRGRLFRQVILESLWIALGGAAAGLLLVWLSQDVLTLFGGSLLPQLPTVATDARVILFVTACAALTAFAFGALPALRAARVAPAAGLRETGRSGAAGMRSRRERAVPIALELALTTTLLASLALLGRSFLRMLAVDPGFDAEHVLTAEIILPAWRFPADQLYTAQAAILDRLDASPAVASAAFVSDLPFTEWNSFSRLVPSDRPIPDEPPLIETQSITQGYFETMGIPIVAGRDFDARDDAGSPHVLIVSRAYARQFFPDRDPIGLSVIQPDAPERTEFRIVGIVEDLLDDGYARPTEPRAYAPLAQFPERWAALVVRLSGDPAAFAPALRQLVGTVDREIALTNVRSMHALMQATLSSQRGVLRVTAVFAVLAFVLAGVGVYGVVAYGVASRIPEIGVRLALGAAPGAIQRAVLGDAARAAAPGLAAGIVLALGAGRLLRSTLFGVAPLDGIALLITAAAIAAVTFAAAAIPARRAARVPPAVALRWDI